MERSESSDPCLLTVVQAKPVHMHVKLYFFQILTSVLQEHSVVILMLCVLTPKDRTSVLVKLAIREMEKHVKVTFVVVETARTVIFAS